MHWSVFVYGTVPVEALTDCWPQQHPIKERGFCYAPTTTRQAFEAYLLDLSLLLPCWIARAITVLPPGASPLVESILLPFFGSFWRNETKPSRTASPVLQFSFSLGQRAHAPRTLFPPPHPTSSQLFSCFVSNILDSALTFSLPHATGRRLQLDRLPSQLTFPCIHPSSSNPRHPPIA